jgi:hypothetical protein
MGKDASTRYEFIMERLRARTRLIFSRESPRTPARRRAVKHLRALIPAALLLGCTAGEEAFDLESEGIGAAVEFEFRVIPPHVDGPAQPSPPTLEPPPAPLPTPTRWTMWHVLEDVEGWLDLEVGATPCEIELPQFPTVAADGSVLALALVSAPVADQKLLTIRMLRSEDAKQMRAYTLIGPGESELAPEELARRVCHRMKPLTRALASGGHTSMPVVGGWESPIRDGLPERNDGWPKVISDGATRDVDMAVADIVISRSDAAAPELLLRTAGPQACRDSSDESDQFSKVWEATGLRVFTRGPCGC